MKNKSLWVKIEEYCAKLKILMQIYNIWVIKMNCQNYAND